MSVTEYFGNTLIYRVSTNTENRRITLMTGISIKGVSNEVGLVQRKKKKNIALSNYYKIVVFIIGIHCVPKVDPKNRCCTTKSLYTALLICFSYTQGVS